MPFRDREWEDLQRDCAFFPAYTDYVFGVDTRPEVADEPGLHPQIFDAQPQTQMWPQRLYGLPPVQYAAACDVGRGDSQELLPGSGALGAYASGWRGGERMAMLRRESELEGMQYTPTPVPRQLPAPALQSQGHMHAMLRQESSLESTQPASILARGQLHDPNSQYPQHFQPQAQTTSGLAVLRQESSFEPTPTPAPRGLPVSAPQFQPHPHAIPGPSILRQDSSMGPSLQPTPSLVPHESLVSGLQPQALTMPGPSHVSMPRYDSPMGAPQPQTLPPQRAQPIVGRLKILQPDELLNNHLYSVLPQGRCIEVNTMIVKAWDIVKSDISPQQKAPAIDYITNMSRGVAAKIEEYRAAAAELERRLG